MTVNSPIRDGPHVVSAHLAHLRTHIRARLAYAYFSQYHHCSRSSPVVRISQSVGPVTQIGDAHD